MKTILKHTALALSLAALAGCQDESVSPPDLDVSLEKTTFKVGEEVRFKFSGYSDYLTIFTGVDNYTAGNVEGTFKGSRYIYRERGSEPGVSTLSFNCRKDNLNALANAKLQLLISTDFNGNMNIEDINAATWTDITDRAKWPEATTASGANVASGAIDLSEWNGKIIYVALKYTAGAGADQYGFTLSSFTLNNKVETDTNNYVIWNNGSAPKFGTRSNILSEDEVNTMYNWTLGTSLVCKGGSGTGTQALESWLISSPVDPAKVDPDYGTIIKSYAGSVPDHYSFKYFKAGTFTATVVARNASYSGIEEVVKNFELTIEPVEP